MEESAQRRERLKAMRMEASQEAASDKDGNEHSSVSLTNPLLESTANPEAQGHSFAQSFNYYTDPMAAYAGNKQKSKVSPQISQDYSSTLQRSRTNETFPSLPLQSHINQSPNPRMPQPQGGYPTPGGYRGRGVQGGYPSPQPHFTSSPGSGSGRGGYPSPNFNNNQGRGSGRGYPTPIPTPGPRPHFTNSPNYGSGQGGYPNAGPNQGRGHWFGNNMSSVPSSGRGRGRWSGQGGGRGGGHNNVSAEDRPDLFYNKSMVEDPWKFLEPVIWKSLKKPWLPHSLGAKRPRASESPRQQHQSSSQPSLAEILAASFNEAASDEPNAE